MDALQHSWCKLLDWLEEEKELNQKRAEWGIIFKLKTFFFLLFFLKTPKVAISLLMIRLLSCSCGGNSWAAKRKSATADLLSCSLLIILGLCEPGERLAVVWLMCHLYADDYTLYTLWHNTSLWIIWEGLESWSFFFCCWWENKTN